MPVSPALRRQKQKNQTQCHSQQQDEWEDLFEQGVLVYAQNGLGSRFDLQNRKNRKIESSKF